VGLLLPTPHLHIVRESARLTCIELAITAAFEWAGMKMDHTDTACELPNRNGIGGSAYPRRIQTVRIPKHVRTTYMTLMLALRYWMSLNENGHLIENTSTASTQRMHETMLLLDRIVWQGTAFKDWVIHVRNNHPMFSMLFADRLHPYSRHEQTPSSPPLFI
jgi:hypothetical protein